MIRATTIGDASSNAATDQVIYNEAIAQGVPANVAINIVAQARHESGNYTSPLYLNYNNAFGYGYSTSALNNPYQSGPATGPYAAYATLTDSVDNLVAWLTWHINNGDFAWTDLVDAANYATSIRSVGYYTDLLNNYVSGMQTALQAINIDPGTAQAIGTGSVILILIGLLWLVASDR